MSLPFIGLDMDGVICTPFLGRNIAISRQLDLGPDPETRSIRELEPEQRRAYLAVRRRVEFLRYMGRRPLAGVQEGLEGLTRLRQPVLLTGRSTYARHLIERWLVRYELDGFFAQLLPNNTNLPTAHYKLWAATKLGMREHVDDDGSIAYYLAHHGVRVFLRQWPRNQGLPYPPGVIKIKHLAEVAELLSRLPAGPPG